MSKKKISLIITGPTGVGKTDLSINLASMLNAEIINIDMGQFYEPIAIGTAKPDWKNEHVPHLFFDIIDNPKDFTVFNYRKKAQQQVHDIWNKDKTPIFVGGSGFYIQSLLYPQQNQSDSEVIRNISNDNLWEKLNNIDPKRAQQINKNDIYRLQRALQIWQLTGIKPSEHKSIYDPISDFVLIVLIRDRQELYKMIDDRVIKMMEQGWIKEVQNLSDDWKSFLKTKKIIGYDDILNFLENDSNDYDLLIETIQKKVRNYAKRQITFFKMLSKKIIRSELDSSDPIYTKKIIWLNLSEINANDYIHKIVSFINNI